MRRQFVVLGLVLVALLAVTGSAAADFGVNWTASYYNSIDLSGNPVLSQSGIAGLNFNWGDGSPGAGVSADHWSARFTSSQAFVGGAYEFVVTADDGVRVYIDGQLLLDQFIVRPPTTDRFTHTLSAGTHSLIVEYFDEVGGAALSFQWNLVGTGAPVATATPSRPQLPPIPEGALTATVINARVLLGRAMPYIGAPVLERIRRGETYQVVGRDHDARWFVLQLADKRVWALGYYLYINSNEFNAPVVSSYVLVGDPAQHTGIVGQSRQGLRLRAEPTTESAQIGRIGWGDVMAIVGRTDNGHWYQVIYKDTLGWVTSGYMRIVEGSVDAIPVTG